MKSFAGLNMVLALCVCVPTSAADFPALMAKARQLQSDCGDADEACTCMAGCEVNDGMECDGAVGTGGPDSPKDAKEAFTQGCDVMKCATYCINAQGCIDEWEKGCKGMKDLMNSGDEECDVDCSGGVAAGVTFAVAMLVFGAH